MIDIRLRSKISPEEMKQKIGKILTDDDYNLLIHKDPFHLQKKVYFFSVLIKTHKICLKMHLDYLVIYQ